MFSEHRSINMGEIGCELTNFKTKLTSFDDFSQKYDVICVRYHAFFANFQKWIFLWKNCLVCEIAWYLKKIQILNEN